MWSLCFLVAAAGAILPGPTPDGGVRLHNQWVIHPAGAQIPLGEFPVGLALHPGGRYAAVLHSGYGPHQVWVVDLASRLVLNVTALKTSFGGIAFSPDGKRLYCGGGGDDVVHVYDFADGHLTAEPDFKVPVTDPHPIVAAVAASADGRSLFTSVLFAGRVACLDTATGAARWCVAIDPPMPAGAAKPAATPSSALHDIAPNDEAVNDSLPTGAQPWGLAEDRRRQRLYVALWGKSEVWSLDAATGAHIATWQTGLHPNQLLLSPNGRRLFVANGGANAVSVIDPDSGDTTETLSAAAAPGERTGETPDGLTLDDRHQRLYVANGFTNRVAIFDVSRPRKAAPLGWVPTGWYPAAIAFAPGPDRLFVLSARGLSAHANGTPNVPAQSPSFPPERVISIRPGPNASATRFAYDATIYEGSLAIVDLPAGRRRFTAAVSGWTKQALAGTPTSPAAQGPLPPIHHVIYVIKENRTYDEVFGDLPQGNGDPSLCLFPEQTTPNLHRLAREFVLLDNFYANAEISTSGHEWSTAGYAAEFVERVWPVNYGHKDVKMPYPGEGNFMAATPAGGYLWDVAAAAGVSFEDFGEFVRGGESPARPAHTSQRALKGHFDPYYAGWNLHYSDLDRVKRFIADLKDMEAKGTMPQLLIVRLPNDHTESARPGALSPRAMVAQNDLAAGQLVAAVSHSRFWHDTAIFMVEDDAQNGPDHVDAHRTEAMLISPYVRRHSVDSTAYTTCSMLASIEQLLHLPAMSLFDATATPMSASFGAAADDTPYDALPAQVDLRETNPKGTRAARLSAHFNFAKEDAIDDHQFNLAIWAAMRGDASVMPAPVHAAFVRSVAAADDDDD